MQFTLQKCHNTVKNSNTTLLMVLSINKGVYLMIIRKSYGQFFTPSVVAEFMINLLDIKGNIKAIDPACGDGEFLVHLEYKYPNVELYGCEIEENAYNKCMERLKNNSNIYFHTGLLNIDSYVEDNSFDCVVANPPFNSLTNKITDTNILLNFSLGFHDGRLRESQSVEVLFVERIINLLKDNGEYCIILPSGILSDDRFQYVRDFLFLNSQIQYVIKLPNDIFEDANVNTYIVKGIKKIYTEIYDIKYITDITLEDIELLNKNIDTLPILL